MRKITKRAGFEPESLSTWKRANPTGKYKDLSVNERQDIRNAATEEQFFLCAYCCKAISGTNADTMNEHVEAQRIDPNRTVDFSNIAASCTSANQCDDSHDSKVLPLTPFMNECETELTFSLSGRIRGTTQRATDAIKVLNLGDKEENNRGMIEQRKIAIQTLLLSEVDPDDDMENEELQLLIDDLSTAVDGQLLPFSPVCVNILKQWII